MASRTLQVNITGDPSSFNRSMRGIDKTVDHSEGKLKKFGKAGALALGGVGVAAAAGAAVGLKQAAGAAIDAEKSQARLITQLKASGLSYKSHAKQIDAVIQKTSQLSGLDDEDLQDSFTNIIRVTGNVSKSLKLTGLAADFARAKHMDVAKAGELVAKVAGGNTGILSRYGIKIKEGATATQALGELQQKFAGQAKAYGRTTGGSVDRASVAWENLLELLGAKIAPIIVKVTDLFTVLFTRSSGGNKIIRQVGEGYVKYLGWVRDAIVSAVAWIKRFADRNREDIADVIRAVKNLGKFFREVFTEVIVPVVKRLLPVVKGVMEGIVLAVRGVIRIVTGLINGDWDKAWKGFKDIVRGALKVIGSILKGLWGVVRDAFQTVATKGPAYVLSIGKSLGRIIVKGIAEGIKSAVGSDAASALLGPIGPALKKVAGAIGDGIGKKAGAGYAGLLGGGAFGGDLHGASPALRPFANVASRFGLSVSSGRSDHSKYTASGNLSYHGSGEALDFSNGVTTPQEMGFARFMVNNFGSRLAELIYTPLGFSIKDGKRVAPIAASDHYDHVHVAMDLGRPGVGIGDGPGRRRPRTGDGIGQAAQAARAAGFRGSALVNAVAIAGAESRYNAEAQNLVYPDHSIGMWQINQLAHHGRYGSDRALMNPFRNARAAYAISGGGRNFGPWSTWPSAAAGWRARAARAVAGLTRRGGKSGGASAGGGGGTAIGVAGKGNAGDLIVSKVGPQSAGIPGSGPSGKWDQPQRIDFLDRDLAMAGLTPGTEDDVKAATAIRDYWAERLKVAKGTPDPRDDTEAAGNLKSAQEALTALTSAVSDNTRALLDLKTQEAANYKMMYDASQTQYGALANAVAAAANAGIGGRAGLFFETASSPGRLSAA